MDNNWYDDYGKYKGRISERGEIYDDYGKYKGRISESGEIYDDYGKYKGRISERGEIYDDYGKYKGRISERGEIYDDYGNYHGEISGKDKKLNNCPNNISKGNAAGGNFTGGTPIDGTVFLLIIIGLIVIYCVFSVGPSILNRMIDSFMIIIFLAVALLGGIVGMFCQENQFSTMFSVDYFFLMILWFILDYSQHNRESG